jgi:two-component system NtrC family sensor kinase
MTNGRDRILLVENDPVVADLIGRQALQGIGHQVVMVGDANTAISRAIQWVPDLILVDINLPGLSGKDLLVALKSQGLQTPVVLLAQRGQESDIVQAFRLGAADYLLLPVREAEVISAVERVLKQVHERQERERLSQQLQQTNQELQLRVRELTTVFAVGKAVTSITDMSLLMNRILEGAVRVTQADLGWFLMREESDQPFVLVADNNLPPSLGLRLGQPWDDGISKLVAMSGETLTIHGEPLKRFKIYTLGQSALIVPIRAQKKNQRTVIGLLAMIRRQPAAFGPSEQHLLEALADYASISLVMPISSALLKNAHARCKAWPKAP